MMHRAPLWVNFFAIAVLAATCAASPVATTLSPPLPKIDFIGPPDAVAPLVLAIAVLHRINTTLVAGGEPPLTEPVTALVEKSAQRDAGDDDPVRVYRRLGVRFVRAWIERGRLKQPFRPAQLESMTGVVTEA